MSILNDATYLHVDAGTFFLSFFRDFVGAPSMLVGLFAMLGAICLRKKGTEVITTFFKTAAGFLILTGGSTVISGALSNFQLLFTDLFGINGVVPNNDGFAGWFFSNYSQISQLGSIIMVVAMLLNLLLAYTSRFKYVFLSGHVLFYMSVMLSGVMILSGLNVNDAGEYAIALISASLILSVYMVLSCAMLSKWTSQITKVNNLTVAHTGSLSYAMGGLIGELIYRIKKGKNIKSTENFKFPKWLQFFRNTFISMAITMLIIYFIVYIPEGIMYQTGAKALPTDPALQQQILNIFGKDASTNWVVNAIIEAFTFAAGVEIILYGVRMIVGELIPSFKGISDKLIKNAKAGIDCPVVFPYAPNAVLIGFVCSIIGACIGLAISVGISSYDSMIPVILPGITAQFFLGSTTGVFGNVKGGVWGCIIASFLNGIIITMVPIIFCVGKWTPSDAQLGWGDTDYIIGVIPGLLAKPSSEVVRNVLLLVIPALAYFGLVTGLVKRFIFDKKKNLKIASQENNESASA